MEKLYPNKHQAIKIAVAAMLTVFCFGFSAEPDVILLVPTSNSTSLYDRGHIFLVSVAKSSGSSLLVSRPWSVEKSIPVMSPDDRTNFPKTIMRLFEPKTTIQQVQYSFQFTQGITPPTNVEFTYGDTVSLRSFWNKPEFATLVKQVKETKASAVILRIRGWKDSTMQSDYDDPSDESRSLYKLHLPAIPGQNSFYFAPGGRRKDALTFSATYSAESKSLDARDDRFHGSGREESCTSCHDGLPSGSDGKTFSADCMSCHKAISTAPVVHAPVEMKDCSGCHAWSTAAKAPLVEDGVPARCYSCHEGIKKLAEDAANPHPVASDCVACHSPHSSDEHALLKKDVYSLCVGCHDSYGEDHPVKKHPLRFATDADGKEITCVSCHDPHGSNNKAMMNIEGGRMAICAKCHQM